MKLRDYFLIRKSGYFDTAYYLRKNADVRRADIDPLWHFVKHGWKEGRNPCSWFDTAYYLEAYPDVKHAGINPFVHYLRFGYRENRCPNPSCIAPITTPLAVSETKTVYKPRDLVYKAGKFIFKKILPDKIRWRWLFWLYQHAGFLFKGIPHFENWLKSRKYSSLPIICNSFLVDLNEVQPAGKVTGSIAIHLHLYYSDVVGDFAALLRNMPFPYDLYISTPDQEIAEACTKIYRELPTLCNLKIRQVENRGRNFAPLFCTFGSELSQYDFIAHLHSKKSLYNKGATRGWREYLADCLLGSEQQIRKIFALLQKDTPYGIVYPQNYHLLPYWANTWLANKPLGQEWCNRIGITHVPRGYFDYPAGSMFWARVKALAPLFEVGISLEDFPEEAGQTDGTLAHTLERLLVLCSLKQGLQPAIIQDQTNPSWSSWRLDQYLSRPYESLVELITSPRTKLIAFDIFDTLIQRPLLNPETIKEIVAKKAGDVIGELYRKFRVVAEQQARNEKGRDVSLEEIYTFLGKITNLSASNLSLLKELEEDVEIFLAEAHPTGIKLYRQALATGKPVVLISDMFLKRDVIEACLKKVGIYEWNSIYLSNEVGVRKDSGELYKHVLREFNIKPSEFLMIGDNERSDVQIPCDMGAFFIHLMRPVELARGLPRLGFLVNSIEELQAEEKVNSEISLGLVLNKNFSSLSADNFDFKSVVAPTPYHLGYSLVGPLLLSFVDWLIERAKENRIDHYYFLSREGRIIKSAYEEWCKGRDDVPGADYLVISRRAASVAAITSMEDILSIAKVEFYPDTIENFLYVRYGLKLSEEKWKNLSKELGWSPGRIVAIQGEDVESLRPLLSALKDDIFSRSLQEKEGLERYLSDLEIQKKSNPAVVDIGYSGSVQKYLNKILGSKIHGFYLMTSERAQKVAEMYNVIVRGCFYENLQKSSNVPLLYRYSFELEKLLSYNEPQVQYYEKTSDSVLRVHSRELLNEEIESIKIQESIHRGMLDYVKDASRIWKSLGWCFQPSKRAACILMEEFLGNLSSKEKQLLSNIVIDDYYCGRKLVR